MQLSFSDYVGFGILCLFLLTIAYFFFKAVVKYVLPAKYKTPLKYTLLGVFIGWTTFSIAGTLQNKHVVLIDVQFAVWHAFIVFSMFCSLLLAARGMFYLLGERQRVAILIPMAGLSVMLTSCNEKETIKPTNSHQNLVEEFNLQTAPKGSVDPDKVLTFQNEEEARKFLEAFKNDGKYNRSARSVDSVQIYLDSLNRLELEAITQGFPFSDGGLQLPGPPKKGTFQILLDITPIHELFFNGWYDNGQITDLKIWLGGYINVGTHVELLSWEQLRFYKSTNTFVFKAIIKEQIAFKFTDNLEVNIVTKFIQYVISINPATGAGEVIQKFDMGGKPSPSGGGGVTPPSPPTGGGSVPTPPIWIPVTGNPTPGGPRPTLPQNPTPTDPDNGPPVITSPIRIRR